ncbi:MAG: hypothetical protein ABIK09_08990 [Pseudomonadota bacterium]
MEDIDPGQSDGDATVDIFGDDKDVITSETVPGPCAEKECGPDGQGGNCGNCWEVDVEGCWGYTTCSDGICVCDQEHAPICGADTIPVTPCIVDPDDGLCQCEWTPAYVCLPCGDGVCDPDENPCNCVVDCVPQCADFVGLVPPWILAMTPRPDPFIEPIALYYSDLFVAPHELYLRFQADLYAIWTGYPVEEWVLFDHFLPVTGSIHTLPDAGTIPGIEDGSYHEWDCLNLYYHIHTITTSFQTFFSYAAVTSHHRFWSGLLAQDYKALPGISSTMINGNMGDGPEICIWEEGSEFHYAMKWGYGDCAMGCMFETWIYYVSTAPGVIQQIGVWAENVDPSPTWLPKLVDHCF